MRGASLLGLASLALTWSIAQGAELYESLPASAPPGGLQPETQDVEGPAGEIRAQLLGLSDGERWLVAALEPRQSGILSCLLYPGGSSAYLTHSGLPVSTGQHIWLSARVSGQGNWLRLGFWANEPNQGIIADYALSPGTAGIVGLKQDDWIDLRGFKTIPAAGRLVLPWDRQLFTRPDPPAGFEFSAWPLAQAWLGPDLVPRCKDCGIAPGPSTEIVLDSSGARGAWLAGWGREIRLYFELPPGLRYSRASALVEVQAPQSYSLGETRLGLSVNGWQPEEVVVPAIPFSQAWLPWQQVGFDLSQKAVSGLNYIELGSGGSASSECRVAGIQIWLR